MVAARRPRRPVLACEMALQGGGQGVAALAVVRQRSLELSIVVTGREIARGDVLVERAGVHVGGHLQGGEPAAYRAARGDPADPQAAADGLRQRVDVDHVGRGARAQARRLGALVAQGGVDAVLEDEERALLRELDQPLPAGRREIAARRVVARRLERAQLHLVARQHALQRGDVEAVLVDGDADDAGAGVLERGEQAGERRRLDHRHVVGAEHRPRHEVEALPGPGGDDDLLGRSRESGRCAAPRQLLAQLRQALGVEIGEGGAARLRQHLVGDRPQLGHRVELAGRPPHGQGDDVLLPRGAELVLQDLRGVRQAPLGQHVGLPLAVPGLGRRGRPRRHEGPASDARGHVAQLGQPPVHARRGQVVDRGGGGQLAGGGELVAGRQAPGVDCLHEEVHERAGDRTVLGAVQSRKRRQIKFV